MDDSQYMISSKIHMNDIYVGPCMWAMSYLYRTRHVYIYHTAFVLSLDGVAFIYTDWEIFISNLQTIISNSYHAKRNTPAYLILTRIISCFCTCVPFVLKYEPACNWMLLEYLYPRVPSLEICNKQLPPWRAPSQLYQPSLHTIHANS